MTAGCDALTEKEKQTLRLLVNGYDAKSMARHLGLSVHTVNERLREARRKMAVSSSREAARLLREAERTTPETLGDSVFGGAVLAGDPDQAGQQPESSGRSRRAGWIIGGSIMTLVLALSALAALSGGADTATSAPAASSAETAAVDAGRSWLALLDAEDWAASYAATGSSFRKLNTRARWSEVSRQVRPPLGALVSRQLVSADFAPAPPNGYWIVKYRSSYANRTGAIETLSLAWEDGRWKVTGVTID